MPDVSIERTEELIAELGVTPGLRVAVQEARPDGTVFVPQFLPISGPIVLYDRVSLQGLASSIYRKVPS